MSMRRIAVLFPAVVALAVVAVSAGGAAAASHQATRGAFETAALPTWSPDGRQIAFAYTRHNFSPAARYRIVRTSSKAGGKFHTVLATWGVCCNALQWQPGGRLLLNPSGGLKTVSVRSGKTKRIAFLSCGTDRNPWGCSTAGLVLSSDHEYAAVGLTASNPYGNRVYEPGLVNLRPRRDPVVLSTPLPAEEGAGGFADTALTFSPDGAQLVFSRARADGWDPFSATLRAIGLAGGGSVPLAQSGIFGASLVPTNSTQVQWSPDGSWVAYADGYVNVGPQTLQVVPTTGQGTPRVLTTCGGSGEARLDFSWSPSSKMIAYECEPLSGQGESGQLATVSPDGTRTTNLLKGRDLVLDPNVYVGAAQWSPDASRLLFVAQRKYNDRDHVWTVRANGSHLTRIG
jgi:Tol biopolymer transport system component